MHTLLFLTLIPLISYTMDINVHVKMNNKSTRTRLQVETQTPTRHKSHMVKLDEGIEVTVGKYKKRSRLSYLHLKK